LGMYFPMGRPGAKGGGQTERGRESKRDRVKKKKILKVGDK